MSFQKVIVCGEILIDPELRYSQSGTACCAFRLKTAEPYMGRDGQLREDVEVHKVIVWGADAEKCSKSLKKGHTAIVEGRNKTRKWLSENSVEVDITEIVAIPGGVKPLSIGSAQKTPESGRTATWTKAEGTGATPDLKKSLPKPSPVKPVPPKPDKVPVDLVTAEADGDIPW